jgi:hypothetical protein
MISRLRAPSAGAVHQLSFLVCLEKVEWHLPAAYESVSRFLVQNKAGFFLDCLYGWLRRRVLKLNNYPFQSRHILLASRLPCTNHWQDCVRAAQPVSLGCLRRVAH